MKGILKNLTVLIIAKDESRRISACIDSADFAAKLIVLDNGSHDDTADIARKSGQKSLNL